jgi:hypothetical protein
MISMLECAGHIADDKTEPYPYVRYTVRPDREAAA